MSLSSSFNLESLNLDIESYTKDELVQMFRLPNNYTTEMVKKNKNNLQDKINKLSIESSKKYSYLLFVDNAEKKLVDSFNGSSDNKSIVNMELYTNKVSNYDSNFVIENKSIVYNSLKDVKVTNYNDNIKISHVSVNSIFRPNYYFTQSSNFTINLPETINNVISMRISSINLPSTIYNISQQLGNNKYYSGSNYKEISGGSYNTIDDICNNLIPQTHTDFSYDTTSKKIYIKNGSSNIRFNDSSENNPLTFSLGWFLGFRASSYDATSGNIYAEAPINLNTSRNYYIAINDYQNNSVNKFSSAFSESLLPDNIITKFNHKVEYNDTMEESIDRTRYYDGPTQINKLTLTIYDEYGRIVDLNNNDWSCVLTFQSYRAVQN